MEFSYNPVSPFQNDGLSKEDRAMLDGMRSTAYVCGYRGGDVEFAMHQALKRIGRTDLIPPCEQAEIPTSSTTKNKSMVKYVNRDEVDNLCWRYLRKATGETIAFYEHFLDLQSYSIPNIDKIRAEIESIDLLAEYTRGDIKRIALDIIDKYRKKNE